jgi:hypothetical protein
MTFHDRYNELDRLLYNATLNILVWGSAPDSGTHGRKRQDVRAKLTATFPYADVRFSEDLQNLPGYSGLTQTERELYHLGLSDICIVLDTSAGPGEEIAHYTGSPYAKKLFVLTHERYQGVETFPAAIRKAALQEFYSQTEYDTCNVIARIIDRVKHVAFGRISRIL